MIRLYHCARARSFRVLWMLEELGLPYELQLLPFPPRVKSREYLAVNPLGTVPYLVDGEVRMTESSAICHYLAQRAGSPMALQPDEPDYARYLNFLSYGEATLTFPVALYMRYSRLEPAGRLQPQVAEDYRRFFHGRLRLIDPVLATRSFLCGDRMTAADVSVGYALHFGRFNGLDVDYTPAVVGYYERLMAREAFRRAMRMESA